MFVSFPMPRDRVHILKLGDFSIAVGQLPTSDSGVFCRLD
jgi:hypothetical protein